MNLRKNKWVWVLNFLAIYTLREFFWVYKGDPFLLIENYFM